jgi:spermidine synthase
MIFQELNWARLLLVLSGAAALGWQFIWTTQWTLLLGHEIYAVLAVAAAFLGGLCLGTWFMGTPRAQSASLLHLYIVAEWVIAAWALLLVYGLPLLGPFVAGSLGETPNPAYQALMAFVLPFSILLPSTVAMGVTLPAMLGVLSTKSNTMPDLYAANTLGACIGVAVIVFYGLAQWGIGQSAWALGAINVLCALIAWVVWGRGGARVEKPEKIATPPPHSEGFEGGFKLLLLGFLGMGYQVFAIRVLSLVTENTVYSYALLLMVYLAFHALGAALYKELQALRHGPPSEGFSLGLLIASIFLGALGLSMALRLCAWPSAWWGTTATTALAGEGLAALAGLALPSLAMGLVFTQQTLQNEQSQGWLGKSLCFNIMGAALAPMVIGFYVYPVWGAAGALITLLVGYTALQRFKTSTDIFKLWPLTLLLVVLGGQMSWTFLDIPPGGKPLYFQQGVMASVSVVQDSNDVAHLRINNRVQEGSSASSWVERRLALLPLMFHSHPKDVLMLGLGTGFTANAAAEFSQDVQVEVVELLPEVVQASEVFMRYPNMPQPKKPVLKVAADARRYVNGTRKTFDVIVADVYHPARSGAATLYTIEHFQKIKDRLKDGGVFCQWLALFQMDTATLRAIVAAYLAVYPDAKAVLVSNSMDSPAIGLVSKKATPWPLVSEMDEKWLDPDMAQRLRQAHLSNPFEVWGTVVADSHSLQEFTKGVKPNTDDHLQVSFKAPWVTYAPQDTPRDRLAQVLSLWSAEPEALEPLTTQETLRAYTQAHKLYLQMGLTIKADSDPFLLLNALKEDLFGLLQLSPSFSPADETLRKLAYAVAPLHPELSQSVTIRLNKFNSEHN